MKFRRLRIVLIETLHKCNSSIALAARPMNAECFLKGSRLPQLIKPLLLQIKSTLVESCLLVAISVSIHYKYSPADIDKTNYEVLSISMILIKININDLKNITKLELIKAMCSYEKT